MKTYNFITDKALLEFLRDNRDFTFLHYTGNMLGVGAPVSSRGAIEKINQLKGRSDAKGYIILIPGIDWLDDLHIKPNKIQRRLIQQYWPGEITLVFPDPANLFSQISIDNRIAVRVPGDRFLRKFIEELKEPIISTSINKSGKMPVADLNQINSDFSEWFDFKLLPRNLEGPGTAGSTIIDVKENQVEIIREGFIKEIEIRAAVDHPLILFVCTGNICRSPLAEYYARALINQKDLPFQVSSAGFLDPGNSISDNSRILLDELEIDASDHRSQQINQELLRKSWLIVTMENRHILELNKIDPNISGKLYTLSEFCGSDFCDRTLDIDDPYGGDLSTYRFSFDLIKQRVVDLLEKLKQEV